METTRRNKNRGYQQLTVWQDAIELYVLKCRCFRRLPPDYRRVIWQQIGSVNSVHRTIAEGYCRRTLREYLQFLNIALGSLGESISGLIACQRDGQLAGEDFEALDVLAYKLENGLLKLVESLERKKQDDSWVESLIVKESIEVYTAG